jgi:hypothetical protein
MNAVTRPRRHVFVAFWEMLALAFESKLGCLLFLLCGASVICLWVCLRWQTPVSDLG